MKFDSSLVIYVVSSPSHVPWPLLNRWIPFIYVFLTCTFESLTYLERVIFWVKIVK